MSKVAVVYWSGSGNTEEMAKAVVKTEAEQFAPIDENGFFTFEVGRQSKVLSEIYKELRG